MVTDVSSDTGSLRESQGKKLLRFKTVWYDLNIQEEKNSKNNDLENQVAKVERAAKDLPSWILEEVSPEGPYYEEGINDQEALKKNYNPDGLELQIKISEESRSASNCSTSISGCVLSPHRSAVSVRAPYRPTRRHSCHDFLPRSRKKSISLNQLRSYHTSSHPFVDIGLGDASQESLRQEPSIQKKLEQGDLGQTENGASRQGSFEDLGHGGYEDRDLGQAEMRSESLGHEDPRLSDQDNSSPGGNLDNSEDNLKKTKKRKPWFSLNSPTEFKQVQKFIQTNFSRMSRRKVSDVSAKRRAISEVSFSTNIGYEFSTAPDNDTAEKEKESLDMLSEIRRAIPLNCINVEEDISAQESSGTAFSFPMLRRIFLGGQESLTSRKGSCLTERGRLSGSYSAGNTCEAGIATSTFERWTGLKSPRHRAPDQSFLSSKPTLAINKDHPNDIIKGKGLKLEPSRSTWSLWSSKKGNGRDEEITSKDEDCGAKDQEPVQSEVNTMNSISLNTTIDLKDCKSQNAPDEFCFNHGESKHSDHNTLNPSSSQPLWKLWKGRRHRQPVLANVTNDQLSQPTDNSSMNSSRIENSSKQNLNLTFTQ